MIKLKALIALWLKIKPVIQKEIVKEVVKEVVIQKRIIVKDAPQWTQNHAAGLNLFFKSPIGKDLAGNMDSVEVVINAWAVSSLNGSTETRDFRAGVAHGVAIANNRIKRMADVLQPAVSDEPTDEELEALISERLNKY